MWYCLFRKQEYSLIKVFDNIYMGSKYPSVIKYGNVRGVDYPRFDSGMAFAFGLSLTSVTAGWPFMAMSWVNMLITSFGEYDGLGMVGLLCMVADGHGMVSVYLFWNVGFLR